MTTTPQVTAATPGFRVDRNAADDYTGHAVLTITAPDGDAAMVALELAGPDHPARRPRDVVGLSINLLDTHKPDQTERLMDLYNLMRDNYDQVCRAAHVNDHQPATAPQARP